MRKAFNHYHNIHEIKKQLNDKQYLLFDKALCGVQFLEIHIDRVEFKDAILTLLWTSIKHTMRSNVEGYCNKMGIDYETLFIGDTDTTPQGGRQGGSLQVKGKEEVKGKEKEKEEGKENLFKQTIDYLNKKANKRFGYITGNAKEIKAQINKLLACNDSFEIIEKKFAYVIDVKCQEWLDNKDMKNNLNPKTLFRESNFDRYLNQDMKITTSNMVDAVMEARKRNAS